MDQIFKFQSYNNPFYHRSWYGIVWLGIAAGTHTIFSNVPVSPIRAGIIDGLVFILGLIIIPIFIKKVFRKHSHLMLSNNKLRYIVNKKLIWECHISDIVQLEPKMQLHRKSSHYSFFFGILDFLFFIPVFLRDFAKNLKVGSLLYTKEGLLEIEHNLDDYPLFVKTIRELNRSTIIAPLTGDLVKGKTTYFDNQENTASLWNRELPGNPLLLFALIGTPLIFALLYIFSLFFLK